MSGAAPVEQRLVLIASNSTHAILTDLEGMNRSVRENLARTPIYVIHQHFFWAFLSNISTGRYRTLQVRDSAHEQLLNDINCVLYDRNESTVIPILIPNLILSVDQIPEGCYSTVPAQGWRAGLFQNQLHRCG